MSKDEDDWEAVWKGFKRKYPGTKAYRRVKKLMKRNKMSGAQVMRMVMEVGESRERLLAGLPARNAEEDARMGRWMEQIFGGKH